MEIKGKVHCFFEQSGTFKNEFIKLGIPAEDYDIQNNFNETNHVIDLFGEIEKAYDNLTRQDKTRQDKTVFDTIEPSQDLIVAFFPCIYFCDNNTMYFEDVTLNLRQFKDNYFERYKYLYERSENRQYFYGLLWKLVSVCYGYKIRLIIENPWDSNGLSYLQRNFIKPSVIDYNRMERGDWFKKPTAYWFINCSNTYGYSLQNDKEQKIVKKCKKASKAGLCSEERSLISPDYARNWICDFVIGKEQNISQLAFEF